MSRRRVITAEMNGDKEFNRLSLEAQILYYRMLSVSDDYGVVPVEPFRLCALINPPGKIRENLETFLTEIVSQRLGFIITVDGKPFFIFKPHAFRYWQAQLLCRRQKSEYLKMTGEEVLKLFSEQLQGHLEDFGTQPKTLEDLGTRKPLVDFGTQQRKKTEEGSEEKVKRPSAVDPRNPLGVDEVTLANGGNGSEKTKGVTFAKFQEIIPIDKVVQR